MSITESRSLSMDKSLYESALYESALEDAEEEEHLDALSNSILNWAPVAKTTQVNKNIQSDPLDFMFKLKLKSTNVVMTSCDKADR